MKKYFIWISCFIICAFGFSFGLPARSTEEIGIAFSNFLLENLEKIMPAKMRELYKASAPQSRVDELFEKCCFENHIDEEVLKHKLRQGLPAWAEAQIQEDLSHHNKVTEQQLDSYLQEFGFANRLVRFQIKDKEVKLIFREKLRSIPEYLRDGEDSILYGLVRPIYNMLRFLAKNNYIPDTDFILSLNDYANIPRTVPIFTYAKDMDQPTENKLILIPDWMNLCSNRKLLSGIDSASAPFWENKINKLFWRGSECDSTGFRKKLVNLGKINSDRIDADFVYLNTPVDKIIKLQDHLKYKYLISIDGIRCSWERLVWHLYSGSLVFKNTSNQVQWYYKAIKPYRDYIPVADEQELLDKLIWAEQYPAEVQKIIQSGRNMVANNLQLEDMLHYWIAVIKEYNERLLIH